MIQKEELIKIKYVYIMFLKKHFGLVLLYTMVSIISNLMMLIPPFYLGKVLDFLVDKNFEEIYFRLILVFIIIIIASILSIVESKLHLNIVQKISIEIRNNMFKKILYLDITGFAKKDVGEYISRLNDSNQIGTFYLNFFSTTLVNILNFIFTIIIMINISFNMSIICFTIIPILFFIYNKLGLKMKSKEKIIKLGNDNYFNFLNESLQGIKEIKNLGLENVLCNKHNYNYKDLTQKQKESEFIGIISGFCNMLLSGFFQLLLTGVGCYNIIMGYISIGSYVAFSSYVMKFNSAIFDISSLSINISSIVVSVNRIYELLNDESEEKLEEDSSYIGSINGNITIEALFFAYSKESPNIINNLNCNFNENTLSVIVGKNGAGKSTFFDLLMRFYNIDKGRILFASENMDGIGNKILRSNIAYVRQDSFFFNTSIIKNLELVNKKVTFNEIVEMCKKVYLHEFIMSLPEAYDTVIGANGNRLSGGQLQRLAIARSLLFEAKIILLDEITSDLDGENEKYIMKTIKDISMNHTVIMIAHRLSTIINAPRILVMDKGRIENEGNHLQLINSSEIYRALFFEEWKQYSEIIRSK